MNNLGGYNANYERFKKHIKEGKEGFTKAAYSAYRERSIGLGAMGFHSYLQAHDIPFEGFMQRDSIIKLLNTLKIQLLKHLKRLPKIGASSDISGSTLRNAHLLAVAPNASSSIICGGTSPSIEPIRANVFTHKTLSGSYKVKNKNLEKLINKKVDEPDKRKKLWQQISDNRGSIQNIKLFTKEEKNYIKLQMK